MGDLLFAIAVIVAIVRGMIRLVKWLNKTIASMTPPPPSQLLNAKATPAQEPPTPAARPAAARRVDSAATSPRIEAEPPLKWLDVQDSTTSAQTDAPGLNDASGMAASTAPKLEWAADTDTFVRALILSEALGPPLSRRRR